MIGILKKVILLISNIVTPTEGIKSSINTLYECYAYHRHRITSHNIDCWYLTYDICSCFYVARNINARYALMKYDYDGGNEDIIVQYSGLIKTMALDRNS